MDEKSYSVTVHVRVAEEGGLGREQVCVLSVGGTDTDAGKTRREWSGYSTAMRMSNCSVHSIMLEQWMSLGMNSVFDAILHRRILDIRRIGGCIFVPTRTILLEEIL